MKRISSFLLHRFVRMRRIVVFAGIFTLAFGAGRVAFTQEKIRPNAPLGINLSGVVDWSSEIVFHDLFKASRAWISQAKGKPWGQGGALDVDDAGNVRQLREDQFAETIVFTDWNGKHPGGHFVCTFKGDGDLNFTGDVNVESRKPGELVLSIRKGASAAFARITRTNPSDPIREIRMKWLPERAFTVKDPLHRTFHPEFLDRWRGMKVLRFMDWAQTNNSKVARWVDRPKTTDRSQAIKGVAIEHMIDLANSLGADPWFCMPHLATDDFVRQYAKLVKASLNEDRKIYLEYSNECWNGQFKQAGHCRDEGLKAGLSMNAFEAQLRYYSKRSVEIFRIWEEVFGGKDRLVRVLASQSANVWTGTTVADWNNAYKHADALAIAPYFGHRWGNPKTADKTTALGVDSLMDELAKDVAEAKRSMKANAEAAHKRELSLVAYEAGQHLAGYLGAENNEALTKLFHAANRHPKMQGLYNDYLAGWTDASGSVCCIFSSVGRYSKWGSWGLLEYHGQDPAAAPKWRAVQGYLKR